MAGVPAASGLLGRERELERITDALAGVLDHDSGGIVFVEGEPGIGKTRLVDEIVASAQGRHLEVLRGWAEELEQERPFGVVFDALPSEVGVGDEDLPPAAPGEHGAGRRYEVVDRIAAAIEELALARPLVVVLEDLQWADASSISAIGRLARGIPSLPVLLILTARPTPRSLELHRLVAKLREIDAEMVPLEPLSPEEVVALVEAQVGASAGRSLRTEVARAGGNPLFVIELIDALRDEGILSVAGDRAEVSVDVLPPSLLLTIVHRLRFLSAETLELARMASVLGTASRLEDVASITGRGVVDLLPAIREGADAGVFARSGEELRFRHDLVREAVYRDLPEPARNALHAEAARVLAAAGAPPLRVAAQLELSGAEGEDAVRWFRAAGDDAARRDPALAAGWYRRALERMEPGERSGLLAVLARVLLWESRHEEARIAAEEALSTARDPEEEWEARLVLARVSMFGSRQQEAIAQIDALLERELSQGQRAILLGSRAQARSYADDFAGAADDAARALELGEEADAPEAIVLGGLVACLLRYYEGRVLEAAEIGERAVAAGKRASWEPGTVPFGRATANTEFAAACLEMDRVDDARGALRDVLAMYHADGMTVLTPLTHYVAGWLGLVTAEWDDAAAELEAGLQTAEDYDNPWTRTLGRALLAVIEVHRDDLERARELAREIEAALASGDALVFEVCIGHWAVALLREAEGDTAAALDRLRAAWDVVAAGALVCARTVGPDYVRLERRAGEPSRAAAAAALVQDVAARAPGVASASAVDLRCRGLAEGDPRALAQAVAEYARSPRAVEGALAGVELAELAGDEVERAEVVAILEGAVQTFRAVGATRDLNRALARLRQLGVRVGSDASRSRPQTGWESLTPTERRVVDLVAEGLSNPQIAERLFVSRRTVESHLSRVFPKLEVASRAEIIASAARRR